MSAYIDFKLSKKEKSDFFGVLLSTVPRTINKTVTRISGNDSVFEFSLATPYSTTTATFTDSFSLNMNKANNLTFLYFFHQHKLFGS
jgi:hypothetical protein